MLTVDLKCTTLGVGDHEEGYGEVAGTLEHDLDGLAATHAAGTGKVLDWALASAHASMLPYCSGAAYACSTQTRP